MQPRFVIPIALASVFVGLVQAQTTQSSGDPFSLTIKAPTSKVAVGAPVYLELKLLNTSGQTTMAASPFQTYAGDPGYEYSCRDSSGKTVSKEIMMDGSIHDPPLLKPGQTYTSTVLLDRVCDLGQPDRYEIQLSRGFPIGRRDHVVRSNKIIITVIPSDKRF